MKSYKFNPQLYKNELQKVLTAVEEAVEWKESSLHKILVKHPKDGNQLFARDQLVAGYKAFIEEGIFSFNQSVADRIKMKPMRTQSGVATVTVLTKPFPCPGKCIFCPNDVKMPKSYLSNEPGAQRAERNVFDPYLQTYNRLLALKSIGHTVTKVELIILGGTWSFYPTEYQIWFIKRCFEAMNDFGYRDQRALISEQISFEEVDKVPVFDKSEKQKTYNQIVSSIIIGHNKGFFSPSELATWEELFEQHKINETALCRNVGLVIETRPDYINEAEVIKLRRLGATKVQIGIQSLNDTVMKLNKRGHGSRETAEAIRLLRLGGFKIHGHWMPNLYGSTVESDINDYKKLWLPKFSPDELKIYPTSVIAGTELSNLYKKGKYQPYSYEELLHVMTSVLLMTPRFCRLTRIVRDIPSTDIIAGNKLTNFRQIAEAELKKAAKRCEDIRSREVKLQAVRFDELELEIINYKTTVGTEYFISYKTKKDDKIAAFLRLALLDKKLSQAHFIEELKNKAIIREIHVYGEALSLGEKREGKSQHLGLGTLLITKAKEIAEEKDFRQIAVISAIGTREYYKKKGFEIGELYMTSLARN